MAEWPIFETMKRLLYLVFLCGLTAWSQRDAAHWYFGNFAGLEFNTGTAQSLDDGALDTTEGCSAISDKDTGALLFYTEGTTIWNKNHELMLNGTDLLGSLSSTQSAVIVPLPGNDTLFYVITTDVVQAYQNGGVGNGINYSVVSMTGDGGLGEVIEKNTPLLPEGSEKVSVVESADGADFWIVTHYEGAFYSFLLNAAGINMTPVVSSLGPTIDDFENFRGAMKIAPDGSQLAIAHTLFEPALGGLAYLYDFNNDTGVVSNQTLISNALVYYGVEFSSDSSKLYFSGKTLDDQGLSDRIVIEQYDLNASPVPNSRYVVLDQENELLSDLAGALQIAMDRKIYHALPGTSLSVINAPKLSGSAIGFSESSLSLGFRSSSFGLPQYIQSFFESFITIENICEGDITSFVVDPNANVTGASWDFGDIGSGPDNTSTLINPTHTFSAPGVYTVTVEFLFSDRVPKTFIEFVEITPQLDLPPSLAFSQCDIDGINDGMTVFNLLSATDAALNIDNVSYRYYKTLLDAQLDQNVITNANFYLNETNGEVIYLIVGNDSECNAIVPITLQVTTSGGNGDFEYSICDVLLSKADVWATLAILKSQILLSYPDTADLEFYLSFNDLVTQVNSLTVDSVPHSFEALGFTTVFYRVSDGPNCLITGEVSLDILQGVDEEAQNVNYCVSDGGVSLVPDDTYLTYEWSTGETSPTIFVNEPGPYNLEVTTLSGCSGRLQFVVEQVDLFDISVEINDFQQSNSIIVRPSDPTIALLYSIDGGLTYQQNGIFKNLIPDYYSLIVKDLEGCNSINELLLIRGAPRYFTPNGDGFNDFWHVNDAATYPGLTVEIMDRFGKSIASLNNTSQGWDGTYGGQELPTNGYWYHIQYEGESYVGHFTLIRRGS